MAAENWQGAKPLPALITFLLGVLLYFGLPAVAPVPSPANFRGTITAGASRVPVVEHPTPAQDVDIKAWWGYGLLISLLNVAIWLGVGLLWWKLVGIW